MTDVFPLLPPFSWRGTSYPVTARNMSFLHESVDHRIQFRSNDFPEPIGPHSPLFKYTIPMREDIAVGEYENLFNIGLVLLYGDMRSKEPGDLVDPIYGEYRCIPISYSETTDVNKRDGTDVSVEFLYAPRIGDTDPELPPTITGVLNLVGQAGMLDEDLKLRDWKQEPSPEGMTDILSSANGLLRRGLRQKDKLIANVDAITYKLQKIEETIDVVENPQNWGLRESARDLQLELIKAKERLNEDPGTKVKRIVTNSVTTVMALSKDLGVTVSDLLLINPGLARSPYVKSGTKILLKQKADKTRYS